MKRLWAPTLTRRVIGALLLAFALVWVVLMAFQYWEVRQTEDNNPSLDQLATQILDGLQGIDEPAQAQSIATAIDRMSTGARRRLSVPGALVTQLWDRQEQRLVFSSPAVRDGELRGDPLHQVQQAIHGQHYQVAVRNSARWSVRVGQTRFATSWVLRELSRDLTKYILLALPFVLLPVWLGVVQGLRPLRRLSAAVASRSADDLSPIGIAPKYAELQPMVAALDGLLVKLNATVKREHAFVHDAAHELRTPMAVIAAQSHALSRATSEADRSEAEARLNASLGRASHLIHQLLALARMDTGPRSAQSTADLAELLRQDLAGFAPVAMTRGIELSLEAPDRLIRSVDVHAFQSVVHNLVDNAIRYGLDGGRVLVELRDSGTELTLTVADDGTGIPLRDRDQVFDRFFRGVGHEGTGTGLGLSIVRQAAMRLEGAVHLGPGIDGTGCQFSLRIPTKVGAHQERPTFAPTTQGNSPGN